jgi:hypothetical protein
MFHAFYNNNFNIFRLNRDLICLIPKTKDVNFVKHFRPINLLNYSFKIFSKVLTNRLCPILDRLIGPTN